MTEKTWKYPAGGWDCRILFSDIDGTLLDTSHHVRENTRKKILELEARGIPFILLSARMPSGVRVVERELGTHSPIVCYSGGLILDEKGNRLFSCQIPLVQAAEVKALVRAHFPEISCDAYGGDQWIVDDDQNPWVLAEEAITHGKSTVGDMERVFAADGGIHKFLLMGESKYIDGAAVLLRERFPGLNVQRSNANYLEVMDKQVTKSLGVHFLCGHYGISEAQAAAFGDGENDITMLQAAGYGFAMGNAQDAVKAQADYVTLTNDEEGLFAVIRDL